HDPCRDLPGILRDIDNAGSVTVIALFSRVAAAFFAETDPQPPSKTPLKRSGVQERKDLRNPRVSPLEFIFFALRLR
ncbi:MAG: hypothetical protein ACFN3C_04685, partial [Stomatobaculum longum]